jgi:hypothetical protein
MVITQDIENNSMEIALEALPFAPKGELQIAPEALLISAWYRMVDLNLHEFPPESRWGWPVASRYR